MNIIGIDLAKNIFSICVMNENGRVLKRQQTRRDNLVNSVIKMGHGRVVMEACGGSHYWARKFKGHGYEVSIIPAQYVKPFVKSQKNDRIDAEAICEAANRPQMRYVSPRSVEQQDIQNIHRIRERLTKNQVALVNEIRGLLLEYGIVIPKGARHIRTELTTIIEKQGVEQSPLWKLSFAGLSEEFRALDERIKECDRKLQVILATNTTCQRIEKIPGVGVVTATAVFAAVGNPKDFKNARQFSAWLGLVPRQNSTGGKQSLGRITKRGNKYIRKLLVMGANSYAVTVQRRLNNKDPLKRSLDSTQKWLFKLSQRRSRNCAIIGIANKMARRIFVVLRGEEFKQPEQLLAEAV